MPADVGLIQQDSGQVEWHTPAVIINAARRVMGGIDLDPASSAAANRRVGASIYFDRAADGLSRPWAGRVWLNPPFSENSAFIARLMAEYDAGHVEQACVITFASLDTAWARRLMAFPRWYPVGRVAYIPGWEPSEAGQPGLPGLATAATPWEAVSTADAPPKASMVTYIGPDDRVRAFVAEFTQLGGQVDVPWAFHERRLGAFPVPECGR
jgi:hypothetical protein